MMNDTNRPSLREEMDELKSKLMSAEMTIKILVERLNTLETPVTVAKQSRCCVRKKPKEINDYLRNGSRTH